MATDAFIGDSLGNRFRGRALVALTIGFFLITGTALARDDDEDDDEPRVGRFCSATAYALFQACGNSVQDDWHTARAICINLGDASARRACFDQAKTARSEAKQRCRDQLAGRRAACEILGEGRYEPKFDPAQFDTDFKRLTNPNPYFPLTIGNKWEYAGGSEVNIVEILDQTKLIDGVTCVVARDQVFQNGDLRENTDDWFCQAKSGDVYYFGEEVKDYESYDGDNPRLPELVKIDGSFKQGRNGDKGGLFFATAPKPGLAYLEEFSLGNAEDVTEILSTTYELGAAPELDRFVPQQLVGLMCRGDCIVTKNYSLLEPGIFAYKYYARGIGPFLEVKPDEGVAIQLVNCNFDSRCSVLPKP